MSYLKERTVEESIKLVERLSGSCRDLGGPLTNQLFQLVEDHRWLEVIDFQIDYSWAFTTDDFVYARQIQGLVEKQDFLELGIDKEAVAWEKFLLSEDMCRATNARLEDLSSLNGDVSAVLYYASQKIAKVLGGVPTLDSLDLSFGPGSNTSTKSLVSSSRTKMTSRLECSMNLLPILRELLEELPELSYAHSSYEALSRETYVVDVDVVPGKLSFVPKNSRGHRSIVVEPPLNGLLQKGIGSCMKERLKVAGLDLSDQTANQKLARKGSIDGSLATIDLSMASDCVSRSLVWNLLPYDWAVLLDYARTPVVEYTHGKNEPIRILVEKFSSMGNAYTFELETVLFYGLAYGVCKFLKIDSTDLRVYGDDIIIPSQGFDLLSVVLQECGFKLNAKKSFSVGPFRESCGSDYLNGFDIRPYYLRTLVNDRVLFSMHNWFFRNGEFSLAKMVESETHEPTRLYGPDGYGDGHLIGEWSPRSSRTRERAGFEGGVFDTYILKPKFFRKVLRCDYVFPCYSIYVREKEPFIPLIRDEGVPADGDVIRGTCGYTKISVYTLARSIFTRVWDEVPDKCEYVNRKYFFQQRKSTKLYRAKAVNLKPDYWSSNKGAIL
jgi:hypothetical protein